MKSNSSKTVCFLLALAVSMIGIAPGYAQSSPRPGLAAEVFGGYASFVDDSPISHTVLGGAGRFYLTPRLAVGPEFTYMWGPETDRDLILTGNLTWDFLRPRIDNPQLLSPFVVGGGGFFRHSEHSIRSTEGSFTAGGGTRVRITDRIYGLVDFRIGWELHYRITGGIGV